MDTEFWQKFKLPIGLSIVGIVLIIGGVFASVMLILNYDQTENFRGSEKGS